MNYIEALACIDCALVIANNDYSGIEDQSRCDDITSALEDNSLNFHLIIDADVTQNFSSDPCGNCGTRLAGSRYGLILITKD